MGKGGRTVMVILAYNYTLYLDNLSTSGQKLLTAELVQIKHSLQLLSTALYYIHKKENAETHFNIHSRIATITVMLSLKR